MSAARQDIISIENLQIHSKCGLDQWCRHVDQPLSANIDISINRLPELSDNLNDSVDYSSLSKRIISFVKQYDDSDVESTKGSTSNSHDLTQFGNSLIDHVFETTPNANHLHVQFKKNRALLLAEYAAVDISRYRNNNAESSNTTTTSSTDNKNTQIIIKNINIPALIGINPVERGEKQRILVSLTIVPSKKSHDYKTVCQSVLELVEKSKFKTIELLAQTIARCCVVDCFVPEVTVKVQKPNAVMFADAATVQVTRSLEDYHQVSQMSKKIESLSSNESAADDVFVAIGSNMGHRSKNIESAILKMDIPEKLVLLDTSFLYESDPMYVTDQPKFLNCVVKVVTTLNPHQLLSHLKMIEDEMGRESIEARQKYGPRPVDLDIIYYGQTCVKDDDLVIPHPLLQEREFVLRPLADIAATFQHPILWRTSKQLLEALTYSLACKLNKNDHLYDPKAQVSKIYKVFPINEDTVWNLESKTYLMGILNTTPDSFSDGMNMHRDSKLSLEATLERVSQMIDEGADMIDIGGQSTRPGAEQVSEDEEIDRVVPIIKAIRTRYSIPISVDTYRAKVAREALLAGADLVNDVTGGLGFVDSDSITQTEMINVWTEFKCPVCIMHMRGSPKDMMKKTNYHDVIREISHSLGTRVQNALNAKVFRWKILADPGIGFAKTTDQNFEIIKGLGVLNSTGACLGFPILVGPSRKGFIGAAVDSSDPRDDKRKWGTAAACSAAIGAGCAVLRVHDVCQMRDVVAVADKCFR